jgi:hypothetical protein
LGITVDTFFALGAWKKAEKLNETLAERLQQGTSPAAMAC